MASINEEQPSYWKLIETKNVPSFPEGIVSLDTLIQAPDNLKKRLQYIGLIEKKQNVLEVQKTYQMDKY